VLASKLAAIAIPAAFVLPATLASPAEAAQAPTVTIAAPAAKKLTPKERARLHKLHMRHLHLLHLQHLKALAQRRAAKARMSARARVLREARKWLGTPYGYGGTSRRHVDCSGFTQAVMRAVGVRIPRTAAQQLAAGRRVRTPRPGDLYFYNAHHVVLIVKVRRGRVILTEAARRAGTVVGFQRPYAPGIVRSFLA
jgi:cell wall-associated NlpC family hydrolase